MSVTKIGTADKDGVRKNITDLLDALQKGELDSAFICFRRKESGSVRTYMYGESQNVLLLIKIVEDDILDRWREVYEVVDYGDE